MKVILAGLFLVQIMSTDMIALQVDSCRKSSKCEMKGDLYNPSDWQIDIIPIPKQTACSSEELPPYVITYAAKWLKDARPDYYLARVKCIRMMGQIL